MSIKKLNELKYFSEELGQQLSPTNSKILTTAGSEIQVSYDREKDTLIIITPYSPQPIKLYGDNLTKFLKTIVGIRK